MLPLALINLVGAAIWYYSGQWQFPGGILVRWALGAAIVGIPYVWLGRSLGGDKNKTRRVYRFAD
jgi:NADH-quinone oxidoreductase subunit H